MDLSQERNKKAYDDNQNEKAYRYYISYILGEYLFVKSDYYTDQTLDDWIDIVLYYTNQLKHNEYVQANVDRELLDTIYSEIEDERIYLDNNIKQQILNILN